MQQYVAFPCYLYMNFVVDHKEYWKMVRNIRFHNSCFKFGCDNRVGEYMIYWSVAVFLVTEEAAGGVL